MYLIHVVPMRFELILYPSQRYALSKLDVELWRKIEQSKPTRIKRAARFPSGGSTLAT